jgi:hypothetical protein
MRVKSPGLCEISLTITIKLGLSEGPIRKTNYNFDPGALELFLFLLWSCFVLLDLGMRTASKTTGILMRPRRPCPCLCCACCCDWRCINTTQRAALWEVQVGRGGGSMCLCGLVMMGAGNRNQAPAWPVALVVGYGRCDMCTVHRASCCVCWFINGKPAGGAPRNTNMWLFLKCTIRRLRCSEVVVAHATGNAGAASRGSLLGGAESAIAAHDTKPGPEPRTHTPAHIHARTHTHTHKHTQTPRVFNADQSMLLVCSGRHSCLLVCL